MWLPPYKPSPKRIRRSPPESITKCRRTRPRRARSMANCLVFLRKRKAWKPNAPAFRASRIRRSSPCWCSFIGSESSAQTAGRARAASSNSSAASSRKHRNCAARSPASSSLSPISRPHQPAAQERAARAFRPPGQRELCAGRAFSQFFPRPGSKIIFLPQLQNALGDFPPVRLRGVGLSRIPLFVLPSEPRELLPDKRKELLLRRRHEKQRAGRKPLCAGLARGFRDVFQVFFTVRDPRQQWHCKNPGGKARPSKPFHGLEPQIRPGRPRLQQPRQPRPHCSYRQVEVQPGPRGDPFQQLQIPHDQV